jgi:hypothetical protein
MMIKVSAVMVHVFIDERAFFQLHDPADTLLHSIEPKKSAASGCTTVPQVLCSTSDRFFKFGEFLNRLVRVSSIGRFQVKLWCAYGLVKVMG